MGSRSREQLNEWLNQIEVNCDKCLDVGGSQLSIKGRTKSFNVKEYKILDLESPHDMRIEPDIKLDLNKNKLLNEYKNSFDVLFCIEIMEYWYDPATALETLNYLMKPNGIMYISAHFVYGQHPPKGTDMLRYTPEGIEKLLAVAGFKILEHKYRHGNRLLEMFYKEDKMKISSGVDHSIIGSMIKAQKL